MRLNYMKEIEIKMEEFFYPNSVSMLSIAKEILSVKELFYPILGREVFPLPSKYDLDLDVYANYEDALLDALEISQLIPVMKKLKDLASIGGLPRLINSSITFAYESLIDLNVKISTSLGGDLKTSKEVSDLFEPLSYYLGFCLTLTGNLFINSKGELEYSEYFGRAWEEVFGGNLEKDSIVKGLLKTASSNIDLRVIAPSDSGNKDATTNFSDDLTSDLYVSTLNLLPAEYRIIYSIILVLLRKENTLDITKLQMVIAEGGDILEFLESTL